MSKTQCRVGTLARFAACWWRHNAYIFPRGLIIMIEVAVVVLMFIGIGLAMHLDVAPRAEQAPKPQKQVAGVGADIATPAASGTERARHAA